MRSTTEVAGLGAGAGLLRFAKQHVASQVGGSLCVSMMVWLTSSVMLTCTLACRTCNEMTFEHAGVPKRCQTCFSL